MTSPAPDTPTGDPFVPVLRPGHNCWQQAHAHRFRVLVDGCAYFAAVRKAVAAARHTVFIVGWDIDSRMALVPEGADDGLPESLGEFLRTLLHTRKGLRVYVLAWDFSMLYAFEREWPPVYRLGWRAHRRLIYRLDGRHPVGASHHQKMVVVDDRLAFVGGMDLTRCRWDTPEHACDQPLRVDAAGTPYGPFHDVQTMFDGPAAQAVSTLVRERWRRATGRRVATRKPAGPPGPDPWPEAFAPDLTEVSVGLARTEPAYEGRAAVHEVKHLYQDAIAAARRNLYLENQYFTSTTVAESLAARLAQPFGPDTVVVLPRTESGWLEQATMGALRGRIHRRLQAADGHDRYRMMYPSLPGLDGCLNVHSKILVMDDELLVVGSANLSNRSMTLDTECNVVVQAGGDPRLRAAIAGVRDRLLAEHLGVAPAEVAEQMAATGSLVQTVAALQRPEARTLLALEPSTGPENDETLSLGTLADPEQPISPQALVAHFMPQEESRSFVQRFAGLAIAVCVIAALALAWRWTPLSEYLNLGKLMQLAQVLKGLPFTSVAVLGAYVLAGLFMMPITLLIAVTGIVFGGPLGMAYALGGTLLNALATYAVGAGLGRETVRRMAGPRINALSRRMARQGLMAMVVLRLLPVAPFTLVNVIAGASHIRLRDYLLGTLLGMAPGIVLTVFFAHHVAQALRTPSLETYSVLALAGLLMVGLAWLLHRYLGRRETASNPAAAVGPDAGPAA